MRYKPLLILLVVLLSVFALGCVDEPVDNGGTVKPPISEATMDDLIPTSDLPIGLTYLGTHETIIGNLDTPASEAVYKNSDMEDFYVRVVTTDGKDAAQKFITEYKSQYSNYRYDPFEEVVLNKHTATQIKDNSLQNGERVFNYMYIWNNGKYVFIVATNAADDNSLVFELARAVGY